MNAEGGSGESSECSSDLDTRPSCSNGRRRPVRKRLTNIQAGVPNENKRKQRVVMRIQYDTEDSSGEESALSASSLNDPMKKQTRPRYKLIKDTSDSSDNEKTTKPTKAAENAHEDAGFHSDSSSNEALEKCPICLLTFRQQEIGTPAPCEHIFCASCIEAWAKNTQTCPIDRLDFESIIVRRSYNEREVVRKICVNNTCEKEGEPNDWELTYCEICCQPNREEVMLLCDCCNQGYHMDCLTPPLATVPDGLWYCHYCYADDSLEATGNTQTDLESIYEDFEQEFGIPASELIISEVRQPRITRTLQNERIRRRVLRNLDETTTTTRTRTTTRTTTTTTTTVTRKKRRTRRKVRRRGQTARTFVVEYDLNEYDKKFPIEIAKKLIRRRRRRRRRVGRRVSHKKERMTASKRLAEQLGVPQHTNGRHSLGGSGTTSFSLFGNPNALDYFSDEAAETEEIPLELGTGTAIQTNVRLSSYNNRSLAARKNLLLPAVSSGPIDLLGSILDMQDRWHNAAQSMQDVRIKQDGTLELPNSKEKAIEPTTTTSLLEQALQPRTSDVSADIMSAPLYQRGGQSHFNRGGNNNAGNNNTGGGGGGGGYNNRFGQNYSNNQSYRHSTGSNQYNGGSAEGGNSDYNNINRTQLFPINNFNQQQQQQQQNNLPFSMRFNQRNNSNNNQRNSLPFNNQRGLNFMPTNYSQPQQQQQQPPQVDLFGGLPPPTAPQQQQQSQPVGNNMNFSHVLSVPPPPTPPINFSWNPATAPPIYARLPPPITTTTTTTSDQDNSNQAECPNYSIYSAETLGLTKSDKTAETTRENQEIQEDEEKEEDLVQLDDDEPELNEAQNEAETDLYEPENPTDENFEDESKRDNEKDDQVDSENEATSSEKGRTVENNDNEKYRTADDGDDGGDDDDDDDDDENDNDNNKHDVNNTSDSDSDIDHKKHATKNDKSPEKITKKCKKDAASHKSVLELYDDSDWEELDIDKPNETKGETAAAAEEERETSTANIELDRSYTPCLDEPIEPDMEHLSAITPEHATPTNKSPTVTKSAKEATTNDSLQTELISEEEEHHKHTTQARSRYRDRDRDRERDRDRANRRSPRRERQNASSVERFKKVSNRQKERNYRGVGSGAVNDDKNRRNKRAFNSRSRSRSPVNLRYRSRSRSLRRRSPPLNRHERFSRSRSRSARRQRAAYRSRSRQRSRSPFNNKENQRQNNNRREKNSRNTRPKRRELPRYDVRNVISNQTQRVNKDRYGRDAARPAQHSRSGSRETRFPRARSFSRPNSRSRSRTPSLQRQRPRRSSFSMSPTPTPPPLHYGQRSAMSISPTRRYESPPPAAMSHLRVNITRSRSNSPLPARTNGGRRSPLHVDKFRRSRSPILSKEAHGTNNYEPAKSLSRGRNRNRSLSVERSRLRSKKKKSKERKKKRDKKRSSLVPEPATATLPHESDHYEMERTKKKRRHDIKHWSPISPVAMVNEVVVGNVHENISWTPPPRDLMHEQTIMETQKLDKHKRNKKKKKTVEKRKDKRRLRRSVSHEPAPSKEVFASGNNILVSVSFNKEANTQSQSTSTSGMQQTTVVTLPPHREDILDKRRRHSLDAAGSKQTQQPQQQNDSTAAPTSGKRKDKTHRRRTKIDAKPVAIIDLERSPFQVQQDTTDVIVLTDSEDTNEQQQQSILSASAGEDDESNVQKQKSAVQNQNNVESMDESYEQPTTQTNMNTATGPKTPPEPHVVKFNIQSKKTVNARNPLHDEASDGLSEEETQCREEDTVHRESTATPRSETAATNVDNVTENVVVAQKIGPNTPPESAPCSPDAYDPFEPTKSPSISPSSPTPSSNAATNTLNDKVTENIDGKSTTMEQQQQATVSGTNTASSVHITTTAATQTSLNAVDLVMAFMNTKGTNNNTNDTPHIPGVNDDVAINQNNNNNNNKHDNNAADNNNLQVLSNVLLTSPVASGLLGLNKSSQLPALGGSVGSNGSNAGNVAGNNTTNNTMNLDDSYNITDYDSPYSPGSADYEDLFEPPPENANNPAGNAKRNPANKQRGKADVFDNLFGSSSPPTRPPFNTFASTSSRKQKTQPNATSKSKNRVKGK